MKRIILMVVTNLFFVIVCWPKLCRMAAHPERYTKEERWKHLQFWVERACKLGDGAQKYATSKNLLRYAVVLVVFAVLMLTHFADPLAAFAGLMGMKASAYLQPFIRGYKEKKRR